MKVTYEKNEINVKEGTTVKEALKEEIEKSKYEVIGCRYNNEYFNLNKKIEELELSKIQHLIMLFFS